VLSDRCPLIYEVFVRSFDWFESYKEGPNIPVFFSFDTLY